VAASDQAVLAPFLKAGETVLSVRKVKLRYSGKTLLRAKVLSASAKARLVEVADGKAVSGQALFVAERVAQRKKTKAMPPGAFDALTPTGNKVLVWLATPSLKGLKGLHKATLNGLLSQDKGPAITSIKKMAGLKLRKNLTGLPLIEIEASKATIAKLAARADVVRIDPVVKRKVRRFAFTGDQEHAAWPALFWPHFTWPITNEIKLAMVEQCHPHISLRNYDPPAQRNFLQAFYAEPLGADTDYFCGETNREGWPLPVGSAPYDAFIHAGATHSILYGQRDYQAPETGYFGMLNALTRPVSSVALNRLSADPGAGPTSTEIIEALDELISRPPGGANDAAPDIISISAWIPDYSNYQYPVPPSAIGETNLSYLALDWLTVMRESHPLVVFSAGNDGYEPWVVRNHYGWCHAGMTNCQLGSQTVHGNEDCIDGVDNDGNGDVDCKDSACKDERICTNRHFVIPQIRNGLVVGSANTAYAGPAGDEIGHPSENDSFPINDDGIRSRAHSSWRPLEHTHDDRRLPHVVASGVYTQYAYSSNSTNAGWRAYKDTSYPFGTGTSIAAPQVAGYAAYAYRAASQLYPNDRMKTLQATRAMVIASARHNVKSYYYADWPSLDPSWPNSHTWARSRLITGGQVNSAYDQRLHRDGAGMVDGHALGVMLDSVEGVTPTPWVDAGHIDFPTGGTPPEIIKPEFKWPDPQPPGTIGRVRFALTWHPYAGEAHQSGQGYDLDFCLHRATDDQLVACAQSWDNNWEFMDVDMKADGTYYYVKIRPWSGVGGTRVTYALSVYYDAYHGSEP
jgi:hypothetical protein